MRKRLISMALAVSMAFSILPTPVLAAGGTALTAGQAPVRYAVDATNTADDTVTEVATETELRDAIKSNASYIKLTAPVQLEENNYLNVKGTTTLDLGGFTLTAGDSFSVDEGMIYVNRGNLTLINGTLDANGKTRGVYVARGTFTLGDGTSDVTIAGGRATSGALSDGSAFCGGGVYMYGSGADPATFTMKSGSTITDCQTVDDGTATTATGGGAVMIYGVYSKFVMESGSTISNCSANGGSKSVGGAVYNEATAEIYGTITGCSAGYGSECDDIYNYGTGAGGYLSGTVSSKVYNNGGVITDGTFSGKVYNARWYNKGGKITGGTFTDEVTNDYYIEGGTFTGTVTNNLYILGGTFKNTVTNTSEGYITKYGDKDVIGTFDGEVINQGTIRRGTFNNTVTNEATGVISGGTFADTGSVNNSGVISNYKSNGQIIKGTFNGKVTNSGAIGDGVFNDKVTNESAGAIVGGTFETTSEVTNSGKITDGTVNGKDSEGTFKGKVTNKETGNVKAGDFTGCIFINNGGTVDDNDTITKYSLDLEDATAKVGDTDITSGQNLMAGTKVTLTAAPAPTGKVFAAWEFTPENVTIESSDEESDSVYTFTMPTQNLSVKAVYGDKTYTITVTGGTADKTKAAEGEKVTLTATPGAGQVLDYWTVNGARINGDSFTMPAEDVTVKAVFKSTAPALYTITVTGGTADKNEAAAGETITLTAEPDEDQELDYWTVNGAKIEGNTFTMPAGNVTAEAVFKTKENPTPSQDGGAEIGVAVAAVAATGAAVWGGYELVTRFILHQCLPEGAAIPGNRGALAQLIWQAAGSPEPKTAPAFTDMTGDMAKAAQWCVEQGYMEAREDGTFGPDGWVPKFRVIEVWNKAFPR